VVPCALKLTAIAILCCGALVVGCGVEAPEPEGEQQALTDQGGAGGMGGESSTSSSSTGSSSTSTGSSTSTSSSSSTGSSGGGAPPEPETCSIMSSNVLCASCLQEHCCDPFHGCLDANMYSCIGCLNCFLDGKGPDCCEDVGLNHWLVECVAFNCDSEC